MLDAQWATPEVVPHITDLNAVPTAPLKQGQLILRRRLRSKQPEVDVTRLRSYAQAWRNYIRGHVVSRHAQQHIVQFMAACCGRGRRNEGSEDIAARQTAQCPPNDIALELLHALLDRSGDAPTNRTPSARDKQQTQAEVESEVETMPSDQVRAAMCTVDKLWQRDTSLWTVDDLPAENRGNTRLGSIDPLPAKSRRLRAKGKRSPPFAQAGAYVELSKQNVAVWWRKIASSEKPPTEEQRRFLQDVIARCEKEQHELNVWNSPGCYRKTGMLTEPARRCLLGRPGAGKSHCIELLRDFFETCLLWTDGVQFQFLATQNTMAELIGGKTVHTWGTIPANKAAAAVKTHAASKECDWDLLFENALSLRWLIIDECSTLSPSLLSTLESFLRQKACLQHPYAFRDAARRKDPRPFGGINLAFAGDLWQLPPVRDTAIFANPERKASGEMHDAGEQRILSMFWDSHDARKPDSIQKLYELTVNKRNDGDEWLDAVLSADRQGDETWEMYCFIHGLPTRNPGSWLPRDGMEHGVVTCNTAGCAGLREQWDMLWRRDAMTWSERQQMECEVCREERERRCRVIAQKADAEEQHKREPFIDAPFVHPLRQPTNHAQRLRALHFARSHRTRVLWALAHDQRVAKEAGRSPNQASWLMKMDRATAGLPGMLPLILDLPVRFTQEPTPGDRLKGVFTNARGWLRGWKLPAEEEARLAELDGAEVVLRLRPSHLYIELASGNKELPLVKGKRIYTLRCHCKSWYLDGEGKQVEVRRFGFPIVPDFGGTAHAYCGTSLAACVGDLQEWWRKPTQETAVRGYIIKSRVRRAENLLLATPYSPHLFRLGAPPGPHYLLQTLQGKLTRKQVVQGSPGRARP